MNRNIGTRLTMQFAFIVALILTIFSISIYTFSASYHKSEFYSRLKDKARTTAKLLIEVKEVDYELLKVIDRNAINALYDEKVVIYDYKNEQIYNSIDKDSIHVSVDLLDKIRLEKELQYVQGEYQVVGLLYTDKYNRFVVIASAIDKFGNSKLENLQWILIIGFVVSTGFAFLFGRAYADRALKPISNVLKQVEKISISSLNMRVNEGNGTDEIARLAITFNKMLERLESAFEVQRSFVSNASHELRTPLTSIKGNIEVSLMKPRSKEEYDEILNSILEDTQNLIELSNRLLDLAKANSDISEISIRKLRIDELLWETREWLTNRKKDYKVSIHFDDPAFPENKLTLLGNEHLLKIAILNLMDNGCKYSSKKAVDVTLSIEGDHIVVAFDDKGIGIHEDDLKHIFQPFFRAGNAKKVAGHGLGLSLTDKILEIHQGRITLNSELNVGTEVKIFIPYISI
jgi:signal transduction histidine kinase